MVLGQFQITFYNATGQWYGLRSIWFDVCSRRPICQGIFLSANLSANRRSVSPRKMMISPSGIRPMVVILLLVLHTGRRKESSVNAGQGVEIRTPPISGQWDMEVAARPLWERRWNYLRCHNPELLVVLNSTHCCR